MSETVKLNFEIPQGYYTYEDLDNYIKNSILKILNTEINTYSSTGEKITIPLKNIISSIDIDID